MVSLTIDLPDALAHQISERRISENEVKKAILAILEIWLENQKGQNGARFHESADPFIRQLISQNRELFEKLARY